MVDSEIKCGLTQPLTAKFKDFLRIAFAGSNPAPPTKKQIKLLGHSSVGRAGKNRDLLKSLTAKFLGLVKPLAAGSNPAVPVFVSIFHVPERKASLWDS